MLWTKISMEPCDSRTRDQAIVPYGYSLVLPLMPDGRIALAQLRASLDRGKVWRHAPDGSKTSGHIYLLDGQWSFVWSEGSPDAGSIVRFSAPRFLPGDLVWVRPPNRPLLFYRVSQMMH